MHGPHDLAAALVTLPAATFTGTLYRAIHLEALFGFHQPSPYPVPRPLYSLGAPANGARFTPRSGMATLYMAEDAEAAFVEANQSYAAIRSQNPAGVGPMPPTVLVSARAHLTSVLDLAQGAIQGALGTNPRELAGSWRLTQPAGGMAVTQQLGQMVFESGRFDGIRYPSTRRPRSCCLAIFPDRLQAPAFVEVFDPDGNVYERLP
jgi:RES domain-containing protein